MLELGDQIAENAEIHCVAAYACDNIEIQTTSMHTQLFMYQFSSNVMFDDGVGYIDVNNTRNIICNNDIYFSLQTGAPTSVSGIISDRKLAYEVPNSSCEQVTVKYQQEYQCNMIEYYQESRMNDIVNYTSSRCSNNVMISEFQSVHCPGLCRGLATNDPTQEPTIPPTTVTDDPTEYPTHNPTLLPSGNPTTDPSMDPTIDPTVDPTEDPTNDPTSSPTNDPSADPTIDPTINPSTDPTQSPTNSPSLTPSFALSAAPTRFPTITDAFDYYISVKYSMRGLSDIDLKIVSGNVAIVFQDISDLISTSYIEHEAGNTWELHYYQFNDYSINQVKQSRKPIELLSNYKGPQNGISIDGKLKCAPRFKCGVYINEYNQQSFELRLYRN